MFWVLHTKRAFFAFRVGDYLLGISKFPQLAFFFVSSDSPCGFSFLVAVSPKS